MTAEPPAKLTRVRDHSTDPVVDWLDGKREVIDGLAVLDGHVVAEEVTNYHRKTVAVYPGTASAWSDTVDAARKPRPRWVPPVETVLVDDNIGTPVFASVEADCQPGRTPTGRISRKPPKLPYTGGVAYQVFVDGSRDDHGSYHGGRR
jgi:hypothetical protein